MSLFKKSCFFTLALVFLMHSSSVIAMEMAVDISSYLWQGAQYACMVYGAYKGCAAANQHVAHVPYARRVPALLAEGKNKLGESLAAGAKGVGAGVSLVKKNWTAPIHATGKFAGAIVKSGKEGYNEGLDPSTKSSKASLYKKVGIAIGACALTAVTFWYLYKYIWNGRIPLLYRKPQLAVLSEANVEQLLKLYRDSYLLTPNHTPTFLASVKEYITDTKAQELAHNLGICSASEVQNFVEALETNALKSEKQVITEAILEQTVNTFRKAA